MTLQQQIKDEVKKAMLAKDELRLSTIRSLVAAFTNELVAKKRKPTEDLTDEEVLDLIRRGVKQRKDSIEQFTKGGRADLAEREIAEMGILSAYLPQLMSHEEIEIFVKAKIAEMGAIDKTKMGMFVGTVMKELKSRADGAEVKKIVESLLQ